MLLSIDPGMNSPGVALFATPDPLCMSGGTLLAAGRVECGDWFGLQPGARWLAVAKTIMEWVANASGDIKRIHHVVFEKPQWYTRDKSKGDPNDLVGCAGVAANVTGILQHCLVSSPTPAEWVGQCPKVCPTCNGRKTSPAPTTRAAKGKKTPKRVKVICPDCNSSAWGTPRGRRIRSRLDSSEIAVVPDQNDAIDAVGIGLWRLGRFAPISVFSNGNDGR